MDLAAYLGWLTSITAVALGAIYFVVSLLGKRFDDVNLRFGELRSDMNRRFDEVDSRFDRVDTRLDRVDTRLDRVETRLDRVETRLDTLHDAVANIGGRVTVLEHRLPPSAA